MYCILKLISRERVVQISAKITPRYGKLKN